MLGEEVLNKIQLLSVNYVLVSFKIVFNLYQIFIRFTPFKFEMLKKKIIKYSAEFYFTFQRHYKKKKVKFMVGWMDGKKILILKIEKKKKVLLKC